MDVIYSSIEFCTQFIRAYVPQTYCTTSIILSDVQSDGKNLLGENGGIQTLEETKSYKFNNGRILKTGWKIS